MLYTQPAPDSIHKVTESLSFPTNKDKKRQNQEMNQKLKIICISIFI